MDSICCVVDCNKTTYARGMCQKHYDSYYSKNVRAKTPSAIERDRLRRKIWQRNNKEKLRQYRINYKSKHPGRATLLQYAWNKTHPELVSAINKRWKVNNKDKTILYDNRRRAKKLNAPGIYTADQINKLFKLQRGRCAVCHKSLNKSFHRDHIVALAVGGSNDITNIQLLCKSCNSSKQAKDPIKFMQQRGFLL